MSHANCNVPSSARIRDWFALLVVVGSIVGAAFLFRALWNHVRNYVKPRLTVSLNQLMAKKADLTSKLIDAKVRSINAANELAKQIDPGPKPPWYHPYDRVTWDAKKKAHDKAQRVLNGCRNIESDLQTQLDAVIFDIENYKDMPLNTWLMLFKTIWNELISPVLHCFLMLALIALSGRVFFRYLLMKGKIGVVRV